MNRLRNLTALVALTALAVGCDGTDTVAREIVITDRSAHAIEFRLEAGRTLHLVEGGRVEVARGTSYEQLRLSGRDPDEVPVDVRPRSLTPEIVRVEGAELIGVALGVGRVRVEGDDFEVDLTVEVEAPTRHQITRLGEDFVYLDSANYLPRDAVFLESQTGFVGHALYARVRGVLRGASDPPVLIAEPAGVVELHHLSGNLRLDAPRLDDRVTEIRPVGTGAFRIESPYDGVGFDGRIISMRDIDAVRARDGQIYLMHGDETVFAFDYRSFLRVVQGCGEDPGAPDDEEDLRVTVGGGLHGAGDVPMGCHLTAIFNLGPAEWRLPVQVVAD